MSYINIVVDYMYLPYIPLCVPDYLVHTDDNFNRNFHLYQFKLLSKAIYVKPVNGMIIKQVKMIRGDPISKVYKLQVKIRSKVI